ncbi:alkaline phosphatase family protein [Tenacibaculum soleae]|uniref:alkaline phosphatase family protein n=1 Tax=Tenacibaculum soleae TaxID=447689 RepID=UPI0026E2D445|nr:alkaline phosphatase family protein [Tenacibaculum soleae]MDO6812670.1 alkaline phosphatase family protein [Tenacibaculum soleae]
MKTNFNILLILLLLSSTINSQQKKVTQKVILITLDGLRWQELFSGADEKLITNKKYVSNIKELKNKFWKETEKERREKLFPFLWSTISQIGQIHGNRTLGSKMNLTNKHWFSYPGYNEILTGSSDDAKIKSNDKIPNPNITILEKANKNKAYKNKVLAVGSWDVFPFIINENRSGISVNAGYRPAKGGNLTEREKLLNSMQKSIPKEWKNVRFDAFTHYYALEKIKKDHPNFIFISYGETDDYAHDGDYEKYLKSANNTDTMIKELWTLINNDNFYKGNTTFIITTDHGRGTFPLDNWKSHGKNIEGSDEVWLIAFGNKITPTGEFSKKEQLYTNQIAATIAKILKLPIDNKRIGKPLLLTKN